MATNETNALIAIVFGSVGRCPEDDPRGGEENGSAMAFWIDQSTLGLTMVL